ncbi:MAG TPA: hypothetical protein VFQ58_08950 [Flavisolibacter sp.]|nr:hypothetical protein [Flavisolibacter sp.]
MVKAFTVAFEFEGRTYLGLARIDKQKNVNEVSYFFKLFNSSLNNILPGGCLEYNNSEFRDISSFSHPHANHLARCINKSIQEYIKLSEV